MTESCRLPETDDSPSGIDHTPLLTIRPDRARLLRDSDGRSMEGRVLGTFADVLRTPVVHDGLARRFYESVCVIANPVEPIPGVRESSQMLNTMEAMSTARGMDDGQRTVFAEAMAQRIGEARLRG